jgi:hypothetical protein
VGNHLDEDDHPTMGDGHPDADECHA